MTQTFCDPETEKEIAYRSRKKVVCPHCSEKFFVQINFEITEGMYDPDDFENATEMWRASLAEEEKVFLERAHKFGLMKAFTEAVSIAKRDQIPANIDKFFLMFFRTAGERIVPKFALDHYRAEFRGRISFIAGNGIVAILDDNIIRAFAASSALIGSKLKGLTGAGKNVRTEGDLSLLREWRRTRFGYVIADEIVFADELKKTSPGGFAKASGL